MPCLGTLSMWIYVSLSDHSTGNDNVTNQLASAVGHAKDSGRDVEPRAGANVQQ